MSHLWMGGESLKTKTVESLNIAGHRRFVAVEGL